MLPSDCSAKPEMVKILKFGGSSVGSPERIKSVIEIVRTAAESTPKIAVVVSAFGGVTDQLIALGKLEAEGKSDHQSLWSEILERHKLVIESLISEERVSSVLKDVEHLFNELRKLLEGVFLLKELSPRTLDLLMSFGERLSAFIISEAIKPYVSQARFLDAREIIKTDRSYGAAKVDFVKTNHNIKEYFKGGAFLPIITGFIASSDENDTTTLGRGGSDYTAAIIGAALDVESIEIWTDVNGVMTADPRKEPYAFSIPEMSYKEAMEMSYFGAKVIHPPTIAPALEKNIPLVIKNSFNPLETGSLISVNCSKNDSLICGISSIDQVVLLCIQGSGMVGVCGIARRLFGALAEKGINIILISQGSSEHSICIAVSPADAEIAREAIEREFALEIRVRIIDEVSMMRNMSVIAVVGENVRSTPGISGKLFGALGKNGINVMAMAQGSSGLNITVVIKKGDEVKAIRVVHEAFFLSLRKTLNVFLVGVGLIGSTLLQIIQSQATMLRDDYALDIRVIGIANTQAMHFDQKGIALDNWKKVLAQSKDKGDIQQFVELTINHNLINSVFVDCTSSQNVADVYEQVLKANISIVTPNKKANSGSYANYITLKAAKERYGVKFFYDSNVGAGLPIISTINELVRSGDKIIKIEAILSGTLSFLFNSFTEGKSFSKIVLEAQKNGYTEPDPREDLNGMDVARKLLILARESGYKLEMENITVSSFLPEECLKAPSVNDFYMKLQSYDDYFDKKRSDAQREGKVLRFIATYENGKGHVSLQAVGPEHPFYHLSGGDNIVAITSDFYRINPLVIKGQGAGAEVTAGKVFGDIIRLGLVKSSS